MVWDIYSIWTLFVYYMWSHLLPVSHWWNVHVILKHVISTGLWGGSKMSAFVHFVVLQPVSLKQMPGRPESRSELYRERKNSDPYGIWPSFPYHSKPHLPLSSCPFNNISCHCKFLGSHTGKVSSLFFSYAFCCYCYYRFVIESIFFPRTEIRGDKSEGEK
jgi:hypothetical protein